MYNSLKKDLERKQTNTTKKDKKTETKKTEKKHVPPKKKPEEKKETKKISIESKERKVWFRLVGKDLFFFKNENDEIHKGMHNLSGVFVQEEPEKEINGKKCYCFSVTYPKKTRMYYVKDENEYKKWVQKLKIATGYTNLTDLYEINRCRICKNE